MLNQLIGDRDPQNYPIEMNCLSTLNAGWQNGCLMPKWTIT